MTNKAVWLSLTWQGRELEFLCHIHPSDPGVGIMGPFVECIEQVMDGRMPVAMSDEEKEAFLDYDTAQGKALHEALERRYYQSEED